MTVVEAFRNMQIENDEPLENGDLDHEVYDTYVSVFILIPQHIKRRNCFEWGSRLWADLLCPLFVGITGCRTT